MSINSGLSLKPGLRRGLFALGLVLTAVSFGYLLFYTYRHWQDFPPLRPTWDGGAWLLTAAVFYFLSLLTSAGGWLWAVRVLGGILEAPVAVALSLASQIGKYVPGNVAHHLGRAALASDRGLSLPVLAKASVMEIAVAVLAGGVVAAVGGLFSPAVRALAREASLDHARATLLFGAAAGLIALMCVIAWFSRAAQEQRRRGARLTGDAVKMVGCYVLTFLLAGVSFWAATRAFGKPLDMGFCVAAYAIAWVAGFITPGAPAGFGVRESILVFATTGMVGPAAIPVAVAHRLVTALADAAGAGAGVLLLLRGKAIGHG